MGSDNDKSNLKLLADKEMQEGEIAIVEHDFSNAAKHIKESLKLLKEAECIEKYVENLNILGLVYAMEKDESAAFDCYLESLATAEVLRSKDLKALSYSNIGSCYQKMGKHEQAMKYFRDARNEYRGTLGKCSENYEMWNTLNYLNHAASSVEKSVMVDKSVVFV